MKATLINDQGAEPTKLTALHPPIREIVRHGRTEHIFPAGSEFVGEQAVVLVKCGMAVPSDDECQAAVADIESTLPERQIVRRMADLGINDKGDQELYRAGVILGYTSQLTYLPGPNWEAYQAAKTEIETEDI